MKNPLLLVLTLFAIGCMPVANASDKGQSASEGAETTIYSETHTLTEKEFDASPVRLRMNYNDGTLSVEVFNVSPANILSINPCVRIDGRNFAIDLEAEYMECWCQHEYDVTFFVHDVPEGEYDTRLITFPFEEYEIEVDLKDGMTYDSGDSGLTLVPVSVSDMAVLQSISIQGREIRVSAADRWTLTVFDATGKPVMRYIGSGDAARRIDGIESGVYVFRMETENSVVDKKVFVR